MFITAAGRPGAPGAGGNGAEDRCARPTRGRGRRARGRRRARRPSGERPRSHVRARRKVGRGARFEVALARELRGLREGAVVAHMCPIYVPAAPLVRPLRIPLVLWFTHWRASRLLQAAERASTAVTSSTSARSLLLRGSSEPSVTASTSRSPVRATPRRRRDVRLLALGRYSTAKGLDVVLAAVKLAGQDVELRVHGPSLRRGTPPSRGARAALDRARADGRLVLGDAVPRRDLPGSSPRTTRSVNNMRAGAPDKVVYEAAAGCLPVLASNPIFDSPRPRAALRPLGPERPRRGDPHVGGATSEDERAASGPKAPPAGRGRPLGAVVGAWILAAAGSRHDRRDRRPHTEGRRGSPGPSAPAPVCRTSASGAGTSASSCSTKTSRALGVRVRAHEPGRGRSTTFDCAPTSTRSRSARSSSISTRTRPRILHTHLVHADVYGHAPARSRGYRSGSRRSTASTSSGRALVRARRPLRRLARARAHCNLAGARPLPRGDEGFDEEDFEIVHYGISAHDGVRPYAGAEPRPLCIGRLILIKGHLVLLRALAQARASMLRVTLDLAGRGPRARAQVVRARLARGGGPLPRLRLTFGPARHRGRGDRRCPLARRGLRDGRARGDGARSSCDCEPWRASRRSSPTARPGSSSPRRRRGAPRAAIAALAGDSRPRRRDGGRRQGACSGRVHPRTAARGGVEELYAGALGDGALS